MTEPFISVVIDNFNYGRFLERCIQSALDQDYPPDRFEVIVVDDGSSDDSAAVAARFSGRIRWIAQANQGQAGAFNTGFSAARGELVCLMDSDDFWDRGKLRATAEGFADPEVGIVQHGLRDADAEGRSLPTRPPRWPERYELADYLAGRVELAAASGLALRAQVLRQIGPIPLDIAYASDAYLIIQGLFLAKARNLPQMLGVHRVHGGNNWAEFYKSVFKLERVLGVRRAFRQRLTQSLRSRGRELSPFLSLVEDMEDQRLRIFLALRQGRRGEAWRLWREHGRSFGATRTGRLRTLTLLLALAHPDLYLGLYRLYGSRWAARVREALS